MEYRSGQNAIRNAYRKLLDSRIAIASTIKKKSMVNEQKKSLILRNIHMKNKLKYSNIRYEEEYGKKRLKQYQIRKVQISKINHTVKVLNERDKIKKKRLELSAMGKIETKLLDKIKNTEILQSHTLKQLEEAIKSVDVRSPIRLNDSRIAQTQNPSPRLNE